MPATKSASETGKKWKERVAGATDDYIKGVENPNTDWADATEAAKDSYNDGIQTAIAEDRFAKGVRASGTSNWKSKTSSKGRSRWPQGVAVGQADYEKGISPYLDVISSTTLPPRRKKGDPSNIDRVRVLAEALHRKKVGG